MAKEFTIPPVVFQSNTTSSSSSTSAPGGSSPTTTTTHLQQRRPPSAPFQPPRPTAAPTSGIPFMSFDVGSVTTPSYPPHLRSTDSLSTSSTTFFLDEPPLLEELEINPTLIWQKTRSLLNPFRLDPSFHSDPDLSGPFLYYIAFALFQILAGKVQFGIILGWISISSLFLYSILNFLAGKNRNFHLYRCFSVVGYCLMPIVVYSAASLFLSPIGRVGMVAALVFVIWSTRVCSRLLAEDSLGASDHRGLIAYPCFLIYTLFSMLVMF